MWADVANDHLGARLIDRVEHHIGTAHDRNASEMTIEESRYVLVIDEPSRFDVCQASLQSLAIRVRQLIDATVLGLDLVKRREKLILCRLRSSRDLFRDEFDIVARHAETTSRFPVRFQFFQSMI